MHCFHAPTIQYFKPRRFARPGTEIPPERAHRYLNPEESRYLMRGRVIVEEKMDGRPVDFLAANRYIVFAEDLRRKHSIFYRVPGRYAVFDIFDINRGVFVFSEEKTGLSADIRKGRLRVDGVPAENFFPVAVVARGIFPNPFELAPLMGISGYAMDEKNGKPARMEGIVVKPDREVYPEEQLRGKIVRQEFENEIEEHYLRMPEIRNIIDPRLDVVLRYAAHPDICP